jgi:hypothetical protein
MSIFAGVVDVESPPYASMVWRGGERERERERERALIFYM